MSLTIRTVAVVFSIGNFPITNQFGFEFKLAVFHRVFRGINEVHDADTDTGAQGFNRRCHQMNGFVRIADMGQIHHGGEGFSVVDVGYAAAVFVAGWPAVGLTIVVQIKEIHPQANLWGTPSAHQRITESGTASGCVNGVRLRGVDRMGDIGHIADSKTGFPITSVNEGSAEAWVVGVFSRPCLNGHVVNVNPATHRGFPGHLIFTNLHDGMAETRCWNIGEVASS